MVGIEHPAQQDAAWTVDEAASFLGISPKTLYAWAAASRVPSFKIGSRLRFSPRALETWRAAQARGSEA